MRKLYATFLFSLAVLTVRAQLTNFGTSTTITPDVEYRLTRPDVTVASGQSGGVWQMTQINLANPFTLNAQLNFGVFSESNPDPNNPNGIPWNTGADGIAFVLAPAPYVGVHGEDIGYGTTNQVNGALNPINSFAAEFDTWYNGPSLGFTIKNDLIQDHMSFMRRGNTFHGGPNGAPTALPELETGAWIPVTITWDPVTGMVVNLNGIIIATTAADVLAALGGNMMANWGFTGGTALGSNDQRVRFLSNDCSAGRTQTQGGWGTEAHGQNPGAYRDAHFATAFPAGVTVGVVGGGTLYHARWTSSLAVQNYLPAGGPSAKLGADYNNPTRTQLKNNAVGQILALTLSVGFDAADPDFSTSDTPLSDMIINSGPFAGWTVGAFLTVANNVLGNASNAYTINQVQSTAAAINENYVDGTDDNGFLRCPNGTVQTQRTTRSIDNLGNTAETYRVTAYPNPSKGLVQVNLGQLRNAEIQVVNSMGMLLERRITGGSQTLSLNLKKYGAGVYLVKVISGSTTSTSKVLIER